MSRTRILVIEGDDKIRDLLDRFLTGKGYTVTVTDSPEEGLRAFGEARPDLTLLALSSQGLSGAAVCRALRTLDASAQIVVMGTARHEATFDAAERAGQGVRWFLVKPFGAADLLAVVEQAVAAADMPAFSVSAAGRSMAAEVDPMADSAEADEVVTEDEDEALRALMEGLSETPAPRGFFETSSLDAPFDSALAGSVAGLNLDDLGALEDDGSALDGDGLGLPPLESQDSAHALLSPPSVEWAPDDVPVDDAPVDGPDLAERPRRTRTPMVRASTQVLLRTAELFTESPDTSPLPSLADAPPEPWGIDALHIDARDNLGGSDEGEARHALKPMQPTRPTDPHGIYGDITLGELLYNCFRDIFTGRLVLRRGPVRKQVYLLNGRPVSADSNVRSENLGYQLLLEGIISEAHLRRSVELAHERGIRQGEALIEMGVFGPAELDDHLRRQVRERLLNCFGWTGAEYGLVYDPTVGERADRFEVSPLVLIFDGIRTSFPVGPLVEHFDAFAGRAAATTEKLGDYATMLREFADELRVATLCDGRATVGEVLSRSPYGLIDTLRVLRALEITNCVRFGAGALLEAGGKRVGGAGRRQTGDLPRTRPTSGAFAVAPRTEGRQTGSHASVGRPATASHAAPGLGAPRPPAPSSAQGAPAAAG